MRNSGNKQRYIGKRSGIRALPEPRKSTELHVQFRFHERNSGKPGMLQRNVVEEPGLRTR